MKKRKEDLIEAAINFWADKFTKPTYGDRENGQLAGFESMIATFAKMSVNKEVEITSSKIDAFKTSLRKVITEQSIRREYVIHTDWAPEWPLSECLRDAELPNTFFPLKTNMWVNFEDHTVRVRIGNSDSKQIYPQI